MANTVAGDIPDILENFQHNFDSQSYLINAALYQALDRSQFTYNGGTTAYTVKAKAAKYMCKDKYCYWVSELTTTAIAGAAASTWYYLYLDYSAITSGTAITNSELIWSTTAPSFNTTYRGWYNGDDRCIFAVVSNSTPDDIESFYHDGGDMVVFDARQASFSSATVGTAWDDTVTLAAPGFCTKAQVTFIWTYVNASSILKYRTKGSSGDGHSCCYVAAAATRSIDMFTVLSNTSQQIEIEESDASNNTAIVQTNGWFFPVGM